MLTLNMTTVVAAEWQTNQRGVDYQITTMSDKDLLKSRQAIETWQRQTADLFYQLDKLNIDYSSFEYQQKPFEKVSFGIVYSYDVTTGSKSGVPISAVSPGSLMQQAGLKNGDIITSINGISLSNQLQSSSQRQWKAALSLTQELRTLKDNDVFELDIIRNNKSLNLHGRISSIKIPGLVISASTPIDRDSSCGYLRTIYNAHRQSQLYKVNIISINQKNKRNRRNNYRMKLPPGEYQIELKEFIQDRRLSDNISPKYRKKTIKLTIEKNKQYTLAAYLNNDAIKDKENYWRPAVTEEDMNCEG